ncbi:unnamed protein product [Gadus morhua 'NCC']
MTNRPGLLMHLPQRNAVAYRAPRGRSRHANTLVLPIKARPSHWPTTTLGGATGGRQTLTGSPPTLEGPT